MKKRHEWIVLIVILLALLAPFPAAAQNAGPVYTIQQGDTLYSIAIRFGTTVEDILLVNPQVDPAALAIGQEIIIPGFDSVSGKLVTTSVLAGQTLELIQEAYGTTTEGVIRLNRILNPERLYIGQDLVLTDSSEAVALSTFIFPAGESLLETAASEGINPWIVSDNLGTDRLWVAGGTIGHRTAEQSRLFPDPVQDIHVNPTAVYQGRTLEVQVHTTEGVSVEGSFGEKDLQFVAYEEQSHIALQGVDVLTEPGLETLRVQLYSSKDGSPLYGFQQPVRIRNGGYPRDPVLTVPPETVEPEAVQAEQDAVDTAVSGLTMEKGWDSVLSFPSQYHETFPSLFGSLRNYNDLGYNSYHSGLDLYGNEDTQVTAPADGTVVLVDTLPARGQVIYIDHGWGVFTGYGHLSQVLVSAGEEVTLGQPIAMVGSTGRVTGPHLHWEVLVGGTPVDPLEWVERTFPAEY